MKQWEMEHGVHSTNSFVNFRASLLKNVFFCVTLVVRVLLLLAVNVNEQKIFEKKNVQVL